MMNNTECKNSKAEAKELAAIIEKMPREKRNILFGVALGLNMNVQSAKAGIQTAERRTAGM